MMEIRRKVRETFHHNTRWRVSYWREDETLVERRVIIDENMARVKSIAYHRAPPGTDMIKLKMPNGKILVRTDKKQRVQE
jgi:hypothetical protein